MISGIIIRRFFLKGFWVGIIFFWLWLFWCVGYEVVFGFLRVGFGVVVCREMVWV